MSLARMTVPTAIMIVDVATPMSNWRLPVAEVLPISNPFSMAFHSSKASLKRLHLQQNCDSVVVCMLVLEFVYEVSYTSFFVAQPLFSSVVFSVRKCSAICRACHSGFSGFQVMCALTDPTPGQLYDPNMTNKRRVCLFF